MGYRVQRRRQKVKGGLKTSRAKVRTSSFAFIASLPDETKDYLMKLKATAASASQTQQETSHKSVSTSQIHAAQISEHSEQLLPRARSRKNKTSFITRAYRRARNELLTESAVSTPEKGICKYGFEVWGLRHGSGRLRSTGESAQTRLQANPVS